MKKKRKRARDHKIEKLVNTDELKPSDLEPKYYYEEVRDTIASPDFNLEAIIQPEKLTDFNERLKSAGVKTLRPLSTYGKKLIDFNDDEDDYLDSKQTPNVLNQRIIELFSKKTPENDDNESFESKDGDLEEDNYKFIYDFDSDDNLSLSKRPSRPITSKTARRPGTAITELGPRQGTTVTTTDIDIKPKPSSRIGKNDSNVFQLPVPNLPGPIDYSIANLVRKKVLKYIQRMKMKNIRV